MPALALAFVWNTSQLGVISMAKNSAHHQQYAGGWTNPFEKYARQNGNLPQIGVNIKKIELPPPSLSLTFKLCQKNPPLFTESPSAALPSGATRRGGGVILNLDKRLEISGSSSLIPKQPQNKFGGLLAM